MSANIGKVWGSPKSEDRRLMVRVGGIKFMKEGHKKPVFYCHEVAKFE
jgi:hypothetical protein